jgi:ribosomal protein S17E
MVNLLKEYQDMFARDYKDFKGMVKKMRDMKIDLMPRARPIKKRPNKLAHKYKEIVQKEIEGMLVTGIIYPIDKSKWANPMVVQIKNPNPKKKKIYIAFRGLNNVTLTDVTLRPLLN